MQSSKSVTIWSYDDALVRWWFFRSMNPRGFAPRRPRIRENVNEAIRAREVRAVFPDGSVEVMPTLAAVRQAQELGLDLILIAPTAEPPVAKAMDYGQWQYENKKKQHEAKRKQHIIQVKELKFRPNTDDHDYDFKKNHAIRFLQEGNRVKAMVQFRGREIAHTDLGAQTPDPLRRRSHSVRRRRRPAAPGRPQRARHDQSGESDSSGEGEVGETQSSAVSSRSQRRRTGIGCASARRHGRNPDDGRCCCDNGCRDSVRRDNSGSDSPDHNDNCARSSHC